MNPTLRIIGIRKMEEPEPPFYMLLMGLIASSLIICCVLTFLPIWCFVVLMLLLSAGYIWVSVKEKRTENAVMSGTPDPPALKPPPKPRPSEKKE